MTEQPEQPQHAVSVTFGEAGAMSVNFAGEPSTGQLWAAGHLLLSVADDLFRQSTERARQQALAQQPSILVPKPPTVVPK